jgi:hypothetical protein
MHIESLFFILVGTKKYYAVPRAIVPQDHEKQAIVRQSIGTISGTPWHNLCQITINRLFEPN